MHQRHRPLPQRLHQRRPPLQKVFLYELFSNQINQACCISIFLLVDVDGAFNLCCIHELITFCIVAGDFDYSSYLPSAQDFGLPKMKENETYGDYFGSVMNDFNAWVITKFFNNRLIFNFYAWITRQHDCCNVEFYVPTIFEFCFYRWDHRVVLKKVQKRKRIRNYLRRRLLRLSRLVTTRMQVSYFHSEFDISKP